jgi:tetratricopeptide (TPR) repeat protein
MNFKTFSSSLVLAFLLTQSAGFAMESEEQKPSLVKKTPSSRRPLPVLPKKTPPIVKSDPSPESSATPKKELNRDDVARRNFKVVLDSNGSPEAAVKKARALVSEIQGTEAVNNITAHLNLARLLIGLGNDHAKRQDNNALVACYEEAYSLFTKHVPEDKMYDLLNIQGQRFCGEHERELSLPEMIKDAYIYSGNIGFSIGKFESSLNRVERGLSIIDNPDFNPENALLMAAKSAWSQAAFVEKNDKQRYYILAAAYFEAYFKLNPKHIELDLYLEAAHSAWQAATSPLATAWKILQERESRLEIKYADFQDNNDLFQGYMRYLANSWFDKVKDTTNLTKRAERLKHEKLYEYLEKMLSGVQVTPDAFDKRGYVSYVKPDLNRYVQEARLAIENGSGQYASFLAEQILLVLHPQGH